jgi:1,2-diacylglycerol 3-alpha-glucosyltransferase
VTLAILFHRLGPYHHARLAALSERYPLTAIEFSTVDDTYAWDTVTTKNSYPVVSLFTDSDIETKPSNEIAEKTWGALRELEPHIVAIPGWSSSAALSALAWCCATRTPAILMSDSTAYDERRTWWREWLKSRVVRLFSTAHVAGASHVDYAVALGMPRERVFIAYDVVDNDYFSAQSEKVRAAASTLRLQHGLPENYFLASSRFIEKKNLPRLLEAYAAYVAQVGTDAWSLVMLGDGPLKTALTNQIASLGLADKVLFPGFKQYHELPIYYGLARVFIHASTTEQWGLVVNEAMASGLPVLVSERCGCAPDLVKNGVNGFTFDPHNVKQMTAHMLQISSCGSDLAAKGQASRDIIRDWSPATFAENILKGANLALTTLPPQVGWFDRVLLWVLMRR